LCEFGKDAYSHTMKISEDRRIVYSWQEPKDEVVHVEILQRLAHAKILEED